MGNLVICIAAMHCRSASFPTPAHVRREWAEEHGLSAFQSSEYDAALDAVTTRLGVTVGRQPHQVTMCGESGKQCSNHKSILANFFSMRCGTAHL